ncbi:hypothetical protein EPUL_001949 [Erysiphe pulchra]|uniref:proteasome endopeptidase complex n=1 Tax=Erysiphe pulchra TaxID=225359 RepID=A0A2S4PVZ3_9PEZI|nr:hypothetical protein EPUL_001949 [Erysiphe pulchra]
MAVNFKDGVILGADSRTTNGGYVANRVTDKLTQVHDTIWCCRSGSAADTQAVADIVQYHLGLYGIKNGRPPTTQTAAALFQEICYQNKNKLRAGMIIAGWDERHGGQVYSIPLGGSLHKQSYAIGGSGSTFIYGYCDKHWKEGMNEEEAVDFVRNALQEAIKWDGSSGGVIRMVEFDMAALISDFISDSAHFQHNHKMISGSSKQLSSTETQFLKISSLREIPHSPRPQPITLPGEPQLSNTDSIKFQVHSDDTDDKTFPVQNEVVPPSSSSKLNHTRHKFMSQENILRSSYQSIRSSHDPSQDLKRRKSSCNSSNSAHSNLPRSSAASCEVKVPCGDKIKVLSLAHIQSFAYSDSVFFREHYGRRFKEYNSKLAYEISSMPITDVIEMVAGLLTKIVTTNDRQHPTRNRPPQSPESTGSTSDNTSSVSAFHGKNVPNITILSYLSRIHKYCPTTYEVFLSLLIYFDRMTEKFNKAPTKIDEKFDTDSVDHISSFKSASHEAELSNSPRKSSMDGNDAHASFQNTNFGSNKSGHENPTSRLFVVDSYNIHRLVIAGVTCASKFFSDVFYTNSRYAKVGGLPLLELNHLELQFLLLNDFRLFVPVEEFEVYGTMLVEFYAREIINQKQELSQAEIKYSKDS